MADVRMNRKLAAILAADVVGYSRLMEADEADTLGALKRHRETIFDPAVQINPKYSFNEHFARQPFKREDDVQRSAEGLDDSGPLMRMLGTTDRDFAKGLFGHGSACS
jgi:hypothetical protein